MHTNNSRLYSYCQTASSAAVLICLLLTGVSPLAYGVDLDFESEISARQQRWHWFKAEETGSYIFDLSWSQTGADADLLLTRTDGKILSKTAQSTPDRLSEVYSVWLRKGDEFYAKVFVQSGSSVSYKLNIQVPDYENGNNDIRFEGIRAERQQAWHYFTSNSTRDHDLALRWPDGDRDADLVLTDTSNNVIASSRSSDPDNPVESLTVPLVKDKDYYAKVFVIAGDAIRYGLDISATNGGSGSGSGSGSSGSSSGSGSSGSSSGSGSSGSSSGSGSSGSSSGSGSSGSSSGSGSSGSSSGSGSSGSSSGSPIVFGRNTTPPSTAWRKPAINQPYRDPAYGQIVRRMTSAEGTRFNRNTYSRRQAENADGSLFMTYHGAAQYRVYNVSDGAERYITSVHPNGDPQWHPTDPLLIRHVNGVNASTGSLRLLETNIATDQTRTIADLTSRVQRLFAGARYMGDRGEGSPSRDGNRYAWMIFNASEAAIGYVTYDLASDRILGSLPIDARGRPDWISVSPSGQYVVMSFADNGFNSFVDSTDGYNIDFSGYVQLHPDAEHSDIGINAAGQDVYIYIDFGDGAVKVFNMVTRQRYSLFNLFRENTNTSIHLSGKGYNNPGWALISTYNCYALGGWACHKIFAVELYPDNPRIANLAHTYNCGEDYWTETHGVANRDFNRIYFNSDSGSCGIDAEVYRVDVNLPPARR